MSAILDMKELVNINDLSLDEKKALTNTTFNQKSYFQTLFNQDHVDFQCEDHALGLRKQIERLLLKNNIVQTPVKLEELHEHVSEEMKTYNFDDGVNKVSTFFYDTDEAFQEVYFEFIRNLRQHFIQEPFWFQATPTIRIHCPNGINNNHYPRYHTDVGYGHPPEEINFWLPLTDILTGHGFRIMPVAASTQLLKNFDYEFSAMINSAIKDTNFTKQCDALSKPVTTPLGAVLAFDSRCIHTGEPLKNHTRASMDIRILPISQYEKMAIQYQGIGRRRILFAPGHCYHEKNSDNI